MTMQKTRHHTHPKPKVRIIVVGDGAVGKTSLLTRFINDSPPTDYIPTSISTRPYTHTTEGLEFVLTDTWGQEEWEGQEVPYTEQDVVLVCFAVDCRDSFDNVLVKWIPQIQRHKCPSPTLLIGCKTDTRRDPKDYHITDKQAQELANQLRMKAYVECSALTGKGVEEVFERAVEVVRKWEMKTCLVV